MKKSAVILGLVMVTSFAFATNSTSTIEEGIVAVATDDCDKCGKADCDGTCEKKEGEEEKKSCSHDEKKEGEAKACCKKPEGEETKKACCSKKGEAKSCSKKKADE